MIAVVIFIFCVAIAFIVWLIIDTERRRAERDARIDARAPGPADAIDMRRLGNKAMALLQTACDDPAARVSEDWERRARAVITEWNGDPT